MVDSLLHISQPEAFKTLFMAMSPRLKKTIDYVIILTVFAVTGSTAALLPRHIMPLTGVERGTFWYVFWYIVLITPIYQVLLLGYAFLFGKFRYFYDKQKKLLKWMAKPFRKTPGNTESPGTSPTQERQAEEQ